MIDRRVLLTSSLTMLASSPLFARQRRIGRLVIIGGAEDKLRDRVILRRFVELCGGPAARIRVLSAASSEQNDDQNQEEKSGVLGMLVDAALTQIIESAMDTGFEIAATASARLLSPDSRNGLLYGPRSPKHGKEIAK